MRPADSALGASEPLRVVIVDDERLARRALRTMLAEERVTVVGEAAGVDEAEALIRRERPDIVFLDIHLRGESGFELLDRERTTAAADGDGFGAFHVVFVTAHDAYAVRAFEVRATDYLLKPVDRKRLGDTLRRARASKPPAPTASGPGYGYDDFFFHADERRPRFIRIRDIVFIRASGNYTELHVLRERPALVLRTLSAWEAQLVATPFVRVHRSLLVNSALIERIERGASHTYDLYVKGRGEPLPLSRRRASELKLRAVRTSKA